MYEKILKQLTSKFTLLVVVNDTSMIPIIRDRLGHLFKQITYTQNTEEGLKLYYGEKFDLILIGIDTFGGHVNRFINTIKKHDASQMIVVCSERSNDPVLLMKLLNSRIAGFISKSCTPDETYKILAKVCEQVHDRKMLLNYIEGLEELYTKVVDECQECSIKLAFATASDITAFPQSSLTKHEEEMDDFEFEFFPTPETATPSSIEDSSIYKDYFTFLDGDDREELYDLISDIDAALLNAFSDSGADSQHISRLGDSLMRYGNVLLHYQFFSDMGTSILEFGKLISDESEMIAERSGEFKMLISGFCSGLQTFMDEVWEKESDNPKLFNDSIINDATMIIEMISPPKTSEGGDDDLIFF